MADRPVIGRDDEVARAVAGLLDRGYVCLAGPAGIGKSTVAQLVAQRQQMAVGGATTSLAQVPCGALLALVEPGLQGADPAALAVALVDGHPRGLVIDDLQWLDDASVPALQIALRRGLRLLATYRSGVPVTRAVRELLDSAETVGIGPLPPEVLTSMLETVLGGPLDTAVAHWIQTRSDGNPLLARDLAATLRGAGALTERHGLLTADGPLPVVGGVSDMARRRLLDAPDEVRDLVCLLSIEEPLDLSLLRAVSSLDAADTAERLGLVALRGDPPQVWLGHPLYGEVAAAETTGAERVRRFERLAHAASHDPSIDLVRRARWTMSAGLPVATDDLLTAARAASPPLAEQFLRRAIDGGAGLPATLALAGLLGHLHRGEEAVDLLAGTPAATPEEEVQLAATRAFALSFGPQRPREALELLAEVESRVGPHPLLDVARSSALFRAGDIRDAYALSTRLLDQPLPAAARTQVGLTLQTCLFHQARIRQGQALSAGLAELAKATAADVPEGPGAQRLLETWSHRLGGDPQRERELAEAGYADSLESGDEGERGQFAQVLGFNHVISGRPRTGSRLLQESLAGRGVWLDTTRPWVLALYAQAQVLAGDVTGAAHSVDSLLSMHRTLLHDTDVAMAEAALRAAQGAPSLAVDRLVSTAQTAYAAGLVFGALQCWYDAVRYGSAAGAAHLLRYVGELESDWAAAYERRALATTGSDLEDAARLWKACGHVWFAAECLTHAVRRHRAARADTAALRAQLALNTLLVGTEPMAGIGGDATGLTDRESAVLALVTAGLSDREIAERLDISVRTVQTHLSRCYAKLGVRSRRELQG